MTLFNVVLIVAANHVISKIQADTPEEASDIALNQGEPQLCHHCSDKYDLSDCYKTVAINQETEEEFEFNL